MDGEVRGLLHCLHGEISGRLEDDGPLATDPGDNRGPVFVVVPPTGLAFLAATTRAASQRLRPALRRLALVPSRVIELIGFDRALHPALHLVGQGRIAQPPAPPIAGPDMDTHFPGNAPGRTGEAQQKGGEYPVRQRPLALVQQGIGEVVEGALAAMAPVACAPGAVVVRAPGANVGALAP